MIVTVSMNVMRCDVMIENMKIDDYNNFLYLSCDKHKIELMLYYGTHTNFN